MNRSKSLGAVKLRREVARLRLLETRRRNSARSTAAVSSSTAKIRDPKASENAPRIG